jgi:AraC-like DNA-binding protein
MTIQLLPPAEFSMDTSVGPAFPPDTEDRFAPRVAVIVDAAIRIGHRRASLRDLAVACHMAPRTIQWRLAETRVTPCNLLAYCLILHAAWRLEHLGWNIKRTAAVSGFATREAFSNYLRRHGALKATQLARPGGMRSVLVALNTALRDHDGHRYLVDDTPLRISL